MPYAVTVTFQIKPDRFDDFMPLMLTNAEVSHLEEDGCHQFDVATDPNYPNEVFLYEIYEDRAAFEAHLASDHFKAFDAAVDHMIAGKTVRTFEKVVQ